MNFYHATAQHNLASIMQTGISPEAGDDQFSTYDAKYIWPVELARMYPVRPVYLALHEPVSWMPEWHAERGAQAALIRVNTDDLKLLADLPSLCDMDVSFTRDGISMHTGWDRNDRLWELAEHVDDDGMITWDRVEAATEAIIAATDSAAVCSTIEPSRLQVIEWREQWPHHWDHEMCAGS